MKINPNILLRLFGTFPLMVFGDAAVIDRWFWLRKNLKKGNLKTLDAGCGSGAFGLYAAKHGNQVLGLSFDRRNNEVAAGRAKVLGLNNAQFMEFDLRKLDMLPASFGPFDQIICFETIEHILDDRKLIYDLANALNFGGRILITAPYKYYNKMPGEALSLVEDGGHVRWGYTHDELDGLLRDAGFAIDRNEYISGFISQYLIRILRRSIKIMPSGVAWGTTFPLRILQLMDRPLTNLLKYPHLSVGVVASKIESL